MVVVPLIDIRAVVVELAVGFFAEDGQACIHPAGRARTRQKRAGREQAERLRQHVIVSDRNPGVGEIRLDLSRARGQGRPDRTRGLVRGRSSDEQGVECKQPRDQAQRDLLARGPVHPVALGVGAGKVRDLRREPGGVLRRPAGHERRRPREIVRMRKSADLPRELDVANAFLIAHGPCGNHPGRPALAGGRVEAPVDRLAVVRVPAVEAQNPTRERLVCGRLKAAERVRRDAAA